MGRNQQINEMHDRGMTVKEIAYELGVSTAYVYSEIRRNKTVHPPLDDGKVMALWNAGWNIAKIMDDTGATEDELKNVIRRNYDKNRFAAQ